MDAEPGGDLGELFERAIRMRAEARQTLLEKVSERDPDLAAELRSLLDAYTRSSGYFEVLADRVVYPAMRGLLQGSPPDLKPGAEVSHYEIVDRLGAGGMGVVYKARDRRLDRFVALKFLAPQLASDEAARARLVREARAASALDHPNIAVVHEVGQMDDGRLFIAMGWYAGETLKERLIRGPFPIVEALDIGRQLVSALAAAHSAGIVHRDIKPSNVVITEKGQVKLLDFGIARLVGTEMTAEGATLGTVAYMSPEQTRGGPVDARTDLWSVGVVLYEMLAGERPFGGDDEQAVIYGIRHDEPEPLATLRPDTPAFLAAAVARCLHKNSGDRFRSADELLEDLDLLAANSGKRANLRLPPFERITASRLRFRRRPRLAAVAALFAMMTGAIYVTMGPSDDLVLDPERVLVAPFENRTGDAAFDAVGLMAADWITQGLSATGVVQVVPMTASLAATRFVSDPGQAIPDDDRIRALAAETRAGLVVTGSIYRQRDSLLLQVTVTDASRGRIAHAMEPVSTPAADPLQGVEVLRRRLAGILPPLLNPRTQHHVQDRARMPPSFEAYRAHAEGMEHFIRGDWHGAIARFTEAASHDSTFMVPRLYSAIANINLGELARTDSLLGVMRPHRAGFSELENAGFQMLEATLLGDPVAYYRAHERVPEIAPGALAHYGLGHGALMINRPREAVRVFSQLDPERGELRGWFAYWMRFAHAYHQLGQHRRELDLVRRGRTLHPTDLRFLGLEVAALAARGRIRALDQLLETHLHDHPSPALLLRTAGIELLVHGHQAEGTALLERSLIWDLKRPDSGLPYQRRVAYSHYLLGQLDQAEAILVELEADEPESLFVIGRLGAIAARRGDRAGAQSRAETLARLDRPYMHGTNTYERARIAALLGDPDTAVSLLRQAWAEGASYYFYFQIIHTDPDLDAIRSHPAVREFMRPKG